MRQTMAAINSTMEEKSNSRVYWLVAVPSNIRSNSAGSRARSMRRRKSTGIGASRMNRSNIAPSTMIPSLGNVISN